MLSRMGDKSTIEWCDATWNCLRGCSRVSEGCRNCLAPETPILYADFVWRPIGDAQIGDQLFAFDERNLPNHPRQFKTATVENLWNSSVERRRLITNSTEVVTTASHRWLRHHSQHWPTTDRLLPGKPLRQIGVHHSPSPSDDYRIGYLAGITEGDGTMRYTPGQRSDKLGFPQAYWRVALVTDDECALGRIVAYLAHFGIESSVKPFTAGTSMRKVEIRALGRLFCLNQLLTTEPQSTEYARGYISGFFDAEGSGRESLRFSQNDRNTLRKIQDYGARLGFRIDVEREQIDKASNARLFGTALERIRFLSTIQPSLIRKSGLIGLRQQQMSDPVVCVEKLAVGDVVDIQTSTGTFFAAGLATHNCYAESIAYRFSGAGQPYEGLAVLKNGHASWTGKVEFIEKHLNDPIKWTKPRRIFVNSMSDVFHESVYMDWFGLMMNVMRKCPQHTFQILTKRPKRMLSFVTDYYAIHEIEPLENLWLGVSVENQTAADERIPLLLGTPAKVHFISAEPLLGPLDLEWPESIWPDGPPMCCSGLPNECGCMGMPIHPPLILGLDQIIVGGESGHEARPMEPDWARSLRDQCKRWRVSFFMKQMGSVYGDHKGKDLPDDLNIREFPEVTA